MRVAARASPGEVLVSSTVRDAVAGQYRTQPAGEGSRSTIADAMARDLTGGPSPMGRYQLATLLIRQGRAREAQRYLENGSPYGWPVSTPVELRLGAVHEGLGDLPSARRHCDDSCEPGRDPIRSCDRCWRRAAPPSSG